MGWDNVYGERTPKEKAQDIIRHHLDTIDLKMRELFRKELYNTINELKEKNLINSVE